MKKIDSGCANTILSYFIERDDPITHLKVQKLLYFAVGHCLAKNNRYIVEESFQAWPHGPVLPELYKSLSKYGDGEITELIECEEDGKCYQYSEGEVFDGISETVEKLKNLTAWELVNKSHNKDGPWFATVQNKGYQKDMDISAIKQYFLANEL